MHRRGVSGVLAVGLMSVLTMSACSGTSPDFSTESSTASTQPSSSASPTSGPTIAPLAQVDVHGQQVASTSMGSPLDPGAGGAKCDETTIATFGALTGANSAPGVNISNGAKLAVDQHNRANPKCRITLKTFDTKGDTKTATDVASNIGDDDSVVGLIGPTLSSEAKATGDTFDKAGLVTLTASATEPTLSDSGWHTFFRGLANDDVQGPAVAGYLTKTLGKKKVCVVKDDSEYGVDLAKATTDALGPAADASCAADVKAGTRDFRPVTDKVTAANPDAVFYAGYAAEAGQLARQLKAADPDVTFAAGDGSNDPQFIAQAGDAAKHAILSCPCAPAPPQLDNAYRSAFHQPAGMYSVEAYDLASILMKGIEEGKTSRSSLLRFVRTYRGQGLAHTYQWNPTGELASSQIWIYQVK